MTRELHYVIFRTSTGWMGVLSSASGLLRITLPHPTERQIPQLLGIDIDQVRRSPQLFHDLMERLNSYFSGHKVDFPDALDLSGATDFQRKVWETARRIPYGETRSYSWIAEQIGKPESARAVGQALGRNPLPIIVPCHRVLTKDGGLGGYSGGIKMKIYLLNLERVNIGRTSR